MSEASRSPKKAELEAARAIVEKLEKARRKKITLLLVGCSGVGKSSTVNSLMGAEVAPVGDWDPTTFEVTPYQTEVNSVPVEVIDTPGLCDHLPRKGHDRLYIEKIRSQVRKVDCCLYVSKLSETRFLPHERRGIQLISAGLGKGVWKHAVIVFTWSGVLSAEKFPIALDKRTEQIRDEIALYAGEKVANEVPAIAIDNQSLLTPDGNEWLGEFYTLVFSQVRNSGVASFFLATASRLRLESPPSEEQPFQQIDIKKSENGAPMDSNINLTQEQSKRVFKKINAAVIGGLAVTGATIGAVAGPHGALIGGAIGAALGVLMWIWD